VSAADIRTLIDKASMEVTDKEYGHFKYGSSVSYSTLREGMLAFEAKGEPEKTTIKHLADLFEKYDS
jgi:hypothetical protein